MADGSRRTIQVTDHGAPSWVDQVFLQLEDAVVCSSEAKVI